MMCDGITIDDFPFDLSEITEFEGQVEIYQHGMWMGPVTPETEAARLKGLKEAWVDADERRLEHAERLKENRYTGPTHVNGMSDEHKANLAKAQIGNTNAKKPHKYPATRKSPTKREKK